MRSIFVSFDEIGWYCLQKILEMGGNVAGIFTLDDERRIKMSGNKPFDDLAKEYNVPLYKIRNINDKETLGLVKKCDSDTSFVIGWSQLVKNEFISSSKYACVGMHPTLLPRHRGRAPIPWAIIFGLKKTGVTMFHIKEEADNGDIIGQTEIPIEFEDDALSLYKKALQAHIKLIEDYFPLLQKEKAPRIKQDEAKASYWHKRVPKDGIIDWHTSARNLYDWIRALTEPYPGAFTFYDDKKLIVWKSRLVNEHDHNINSGMILEVNKEGFLVSTGEGLLKLVSVQFEGENKLIGSEIREASLFKKGSILG
jgi:methionyl-tRNA formyltransferase